MGKYRKIDPRIWNDAKFRRLSDKGKLAFFFLLTHPHMTALGAMRATISGLASELGWDSHAMRDAIKDAIADGMLDVNEDASWMGVKNFLKYNEPEGPNSVIKAWPAALDLLPECPEKTDLAINCKAYLQDRGDKFLGNTNTSELWKVIEDAISDGMSDAKRDPSPIQEQEQEPLRSRSKAKKKEKRYVAFCNATSVEMEVPKGEESPPSELPPAKNSQSYSGKFLELWAAYPKRSGNNSKANAYQRYTAAIKSGASHDEILAGVIRYRAFCDATQKTGTELVKMAEVFLGPGRHWETDFTIPEPKPGNGQANKSMPTNIYEGMPEL